MPATLDDMNTGADSIHCDVGRGQEMSNQVGRALDWVKATLQTRNLRMRDRQDAGSRVESSCDSIPRNVLNARCELVQDLAGGSGAGSASRSIGPVANETNTRTASRPGRFPDRSTEPMPYSGTHPASVPVGTYQEQTHP